MDTLEFDYTSPSPGNLIVPPVVWKGKSPQEVYRERHSEHLLVKVHSAPRTLSTTATECDCYHVREKSECKGDGLVKSILIPLPEKP